MQISVLMDDSVSSASFSCEHGLSLYLTTPGHKVLFDTGASGLFLENAERLRPSISGSPPSAGGSRAWRGSWGSSCSSAATRRWS